MNFKKVTNSHKEVFNRVSYLIYWKINFHYWQYKTKQKHGKQFSDDKFITSMFNLK